MRKMTVFFTGGSVLNTPPRAHTHTHTQAQRHYICVSHVCTCMFKTPQYFCILKYGEHNWAQLFLLEAQRWEASQLPEIPTNQTVWKKERQERPPTCDSYKQCKKIKRPWPPRGPGPPAAAELTDSFMLLTEIRKVALWEEACGLTLIIKSEKFQFPFSIWKINSFHVFRSWNDGASYLLHLRINSVIFIHINVSV